MKSESKKPRILKYVQKPNNSIEHFYYRLGQIAQRGGEYYFSVEIRKEHDGTTIYRGYINNWGGYVEQLTIKEVLQCFVDNMRDGGVDMTGWEKEPAETTGRVIHDNEMDDLPF